MTEFLVFDTETSGMIDFRAPADAPHQPRLASWCMIWLDKDMKVQNQLDGYVRRDGWSMHPDATRVNGITDAYLDEHGTTVHWPLSLYAKAIDQGRILVAHNKDFDLKIMRGELRRVGYDDRAESIRAFCTMKHLTNACKIPGVRGWKWPRLSEASEILLGKPLKGAHGAVADAQCCADLLRYIRRQEPMDGYILWRSVAA